jgi:hypothetical protein
MARNGGTIGTTSDLGGEVVRRDFRCGTSGGEVERSGVVEASKTRPRESLLCSSHRMFQKLAYDLERHCRH